MNAARLFAIACFVAALWTAYTAMQAPDCPDGKCPAPTPSAKPQPSPFRPPQPQPPRPKPWGDTLLASVGASIGGGRHSDGTEIHCDLPASLHTRNTSSWGKGNCVFTSIHHSAWWQNVPQLQGFAQWVISKGIPGGGHPGKVKDLVQKISADRGMPPPAYLCVQSRDPEILKAACRSGRMPSVSYSRSLTGRYNGQRIAHMVTLVHADDRHFVILDNNYPGPQAYEWLTPDEFAKVWDGWAVILLAPPPPAPPKPYKRGAA